MTDLATAVAERDQGIRQALKSTERRVPDWFLRAYGFLLVYSLSHREFTSEQVSDATEVSGLAEPRSRGWGQVYVRAQRKGLIKMSGVGRSLRRHRSVCPQWASLIYTGEAK